MDKLTLFIVSVVVGVIACAAGVVIKLFKDSLKSNPVLLGALEAICIVGVVSYVILFINILVS